MTIDDIKPEDIKDLVEIMNDQIRVCSGGMFSIGDSSAETVRNELIRAYIKLIYKLAE